VGDASAGLEMSEQPGASGRDHRFVAAGVVPVLVGVEDLGDLPTLGRQARGEFKLARLTRRAALLHYSRRSMSSSAVHSSRIHVPRG
jgi:hypothetical protein